MTLLEILVVLVVVGIIAALSLPAYRQHLVRVHRTEATTVLEEIAAAEEHYYMRHGRYCAQLTAAPPAGLGLATPSAARHYAFSVALAQDAQTYIANATPVSGRGQDRDSDCLVFSLDHHGRRAASGARETSFCWR